MVEVSQKDGSLSFTYSWRKRKQSVAVEGLLATSTEKRAWLELFSFGRRDHLESRAQASATELLPNVLKLMNEQRNKFSPQESITGKSIQLFKAYGEHDRVTHALTVLIELQELLKKEGYSAEIKQTHSLLPRLLYLLKPDGNFRSRGRSQVTLEISIPATEKLHA